MNGEGWGKRKRGSEPNRMTNLGVKTWGTIDVYVKQMGQC